MIIKKRIYPKTKRLSRASNQFTITEKLDGENLTIINFGGKLFFAQRKNVLSESELSSKIAYPGLCDWVKENRNELLSIYESSALCGEWINKKDKNYPFANGFYMFAKARLAKTFDPDTYACVYDAEILTNNFELDSFFYDPKLFKYVFPEQVKPDCINVVPVVKTMQTLPSVDEMDQIYAEYKAKNNDRFVEGFVVSLVNDEDSILRKYVRMKKGKLEDHKE